MNAAIEPPVSADEFQQIRAITRAKVRRWWERQENRPGCLDLEDLFQEAEVGLKRACELYGPNEKRPFRPYAVSHGFGAARHHFRRRHHIPRAEYEAEPREYRDRLQAQKGEAGARRPEHLRMMYFSEPVQWGGTGDKRQEVRLEERTADPLDRYFAVEVRAALDAITYPGGKILTRYHLDGYSQREIASELGISQMHVSRLLKSAEIQFKKVWAAAGAG